MFLNILLISITTAISSGAAAWIVFFLSIKEIRYKRRLAIKYINEVTAKMKNINNVFQFGINGKDLGIYANLIPYFVYIINNRFLNIKDFDKLKISKTN